MTRRTHRVLAVVLLATVSLGTFANEGPALAERSWTREAWENFSSPITTNARYPLLVGVGITTTLLLFEDSLVDTTAVETAENKPLGRFARFGDLGGQFYPNALYVVGMFTYGWLQSDSPAKQRASAMLQASLYAILVSTTIKHIANQTRPDRSTNDSFPSGHTTSAFAFASYIGCRHSLPWGIAAYTLAGLVGYSRMNDNRHYVSDVAAGATIGTAFGVGVCLAENARDGVEAHASSWYVAPKPGGMSAGWGLAF